MAFTQLWQHAAPANVCPDRAVPMLHPLNPLAGRGPHTAPEGTAQHITGQHWQFSAFAVCLVTTEAPARPCQGSGHGGPGCLWGVTACLNQGPALSSDRARPLFCFTFCSCRGCPKVATSKRTLLWQVLLKATTFQTQEGEEEGTLVGSSKPCFLWCLGAALQCCGLWNVEHLFQQPAVLVIWRRGCEEASLQQLPTTTSPGERTEVRQPCSCPGCRRWWGQVVILHLPHHHWRHGRGGKARRPTEVRHFASTVGTCWDQPLRIRSLPQPVVSLLFLLKRSYEIRWCKKVVKMWIHSSAEQTWRLMGEGEVGGDPNPAEPIEWSWKESSQTKPQAAQQHGWKAAAIVELTSSTSKQ